MGRQTWCQVRGSNGLLVVGEDLELVEMGVTEELTPDGMAEPVHDSVVLVRPLVCKTEVNFTTDACCAHEKQTYCSKSSSPGECVL